MNYKGILFFLGIYSLFVTFFSILNILYSVYFDFIIDLNSYVISLAVSLIIGSSFCVIGHKYSKEVNLSDQIILILLTFIFIPLLISIPYFLSIYDINLLNSYFESISGFTTTGFSIIKNIDSIDEPLKLWRSSSQWLGGLIFLVAIVGTLGSKQIKIKPIHLVLGSRLGGNFYNSFYKNFFRILLIYSLFTIFIIFVYKLSGIRLLDSFNLAFTTVSSGGFIPTNNLVEITNNDVKILVLSVTLLFPIFNFYLLFNIFIKKFKLVDNQEDLHLLILIILLTLLFYFVLIPEQGFFHILLSVISSIATSGIATFSPDFNISLFLILLTLIGGSLVSTSSGLKYIRFYILLKISYQEIYKLVKPINVFNRNLFRSETKIDEQDFKISFLVFIFFIMALFLLSSILIFDNLNLEDSFKLSILTLTNTVSSELYGMKDLNFFDLTGITKISLIIFMIFGKVEIIAILYLIKKHIYRE